MMIQNSTSISVSWFCFNYRDGVKLIALASGDLAPGQKKSDCPPATEDGLYSVRFTTPGGGKELAIGTLNTDQIVTLVTADNSYKAEVS